MGPREYLPSDMKGHYASVFFTLSDIEAYVAYDIS